MSSCFEDPEQNKLHGSDSSDDTEGKIMAEVGGKSRQEGSQGVTFSPGRPLSMKLFASWEVEGNSSSCIPRLFSVKLTRLQIQKKMDTNLSDVVISVSMQGSRRVLRSNEINLPPSGLIDTDVDLSFSLQYPHFLKRNRNNVQIMIQRRKRYKTRAILGFKTLAVGLVNLSEILQYPVSAKRQLAMHTKGDPATLATVTMTNLTSQPVENDLDREIPRRGAGFDLDDRAEEDNSSDEDDEYYSSDGSDSAGEMETAQDILGPTRKGRKVKFRPNQIKFKKKFIALLKKFRVPEEEVFRNLEGSPREAEGADDMADDLIYPEDLEEFDSDAESDPELGDTSSIKSQDKPKLRPYFDRAASVDSMYIGKKQKTDKNVKKMTRFDSDESTEPEPHNQETFSPHSDSERFSDSPAVHSDSPLTHSLVRKVKDSSKTRRSVSVKEVKNKNKGRLERRNSDLELQQVPRSTTMQQLSTCFTHDDVLPPSILLVNTSEWQGQLLALKLKGKQSRMICTNSDVEVQDVITAILAKYQKFCHNHSVSPPCLKVAIAGTEAYISVVLRPFVERFSSKPLWQNYVRFLVIPLDSNHAVAKYISNIDSNYSSLFMDSVWRDAFERSDSNADFDTVNDRVNRYVSGATITHHLPIAEVLVNRKGFDEDSSRFVPFVGVVRIGNPDAGETDEVVNGNSLSPAASQGSSGGVKETTQAVTVPSATQTNETKLISNANKDNNAQNIIPSEMMDLQVDYWTAGGKKDGNKSTLKTAFKSLVVSRHHNIEEPGTLQMVATTKEPNLRKVHAKSAFEAMMRGKKSKDRESDTKGMIIANVTKLVCTSKSQNNSLNVVIDGVSWDGVKFFSLSPQWSRHVKTFPIGLFGPVETSF